MNEREKLLNQAVTAWIMYAESELGRNEGLELTDQAEANKAWRVVSLLEGAISIAMPNELERLIGERGQAAAAANVKR